MKNRMRTRKSVGKVSRFLQGLKRKNSGASETRRIIRGKNDYPSSTKVGACDMITCRRRLPQQVHHRRNHRVNDIVQG